MNQRLVKDSEQTTARRAFSGAAMELPPLPAEPTVSVVIANYNYARFLSDALDSILAQTYQRFDVIVVDDGSSDNSAEVIAAYSSKDSRIRGVFQTNSGLASAVNQGYAHSTGSIICFLDADDSFYPEKLELVVRAFKRHPKAGLVYHPVEKVMRLGKPIAAPYPRDLRSGWLADDALACRGWGEWTNPAGVCIRREVGDRLFPISERIRGQGDAYIQMASRLITEVVGLPQPLANYRLHGDNSVGNQGVEPYILEKVLAGFDRVFLAFKAFVEAEFGASTAEHVVLDNFQDYWEYLLALYILEGATGDEVRGHLVADVLSTIPPSRRRKIWRALLLLPSGVSSRMLRLWWADATWKRHVRPVGRWLRIG